MIKCINNKLAILLLSVFLTSSLTVLAGSEGSEQKKANREEMRELKQRQIKLKTEHKLQRLQQSLELKENQLTAWETYKAALLENRQQKQQLLRELRAKKKSSQQKPTAIELATLNILRQENKLKEAKAQLQALEVFYSQLESEQKLVLDKVVLRKVKRKARELREKRQKN